MRCKLIKPLPYTPQASLDRASKMWANAYELWAYETCQPKWQATLGPMHYKMVVHGMEPQRGYKKHQSPPRHDQFSLKREPILADYYANALHRQGVKYQLVEHAEHGLVLEFNALHVDVIARIIADLKYTYQLPEPEPDVVMGSFYYGKSYYTINSKRLEQEEELLAWLEEEGVDTWLHVFKSCGKRFLRFRNERDLVRFRLYQG